jgi:RNA polymerase sigma factor (sigma-70 family)
VIAQPGEAAMADSGSITRYLAQLSGDRSGLRNDAAQQIWQRYFPTLLQLAHRTLDPRVRQRADALDVLQDAYNSFCLRQQRGDFDLKTRDDLWQVLVTIVYRKLRNLARHHRRQRRDYRRETSGPVSAGDGDDALDAAADEMAPDEAVAFAEEMELRLRSLPEPLRQIALWKLEGYTNEEIAGPERLNCSPRTVERKLERIRAIWSAADGDAAGETP